MLVRSLTRNYFFVPCSPNIYGGRGTQSAIAKKYPNILAAALSVQAGENRGSSIESNKLHFNLRNVVSSFKELVRVYSVLFSLMLKYIHIKCHVAKQFVKHSGTNQKAIKNKC
jgi:hypothetical protein